MKINEDFNFCFEDLIEKGLLEHSDSCINIGEKASRERSIEKSLEKMKSEWDGINFEL